MGKLSLSTKPLCIMVDSVYSSEWGVSGILSPFTWGGTDITAFAMSAIRRRTQGQLCHACAAQNDGMAI